MDIFIDHNRALQWLWSEFFMWIRAINILATIFLPKWDSRTCQLSSVFFWNAIMHVRRAFWAMQMADKEIGTPNAVQHTEIMRNSPLFRSHLITVENHSQCDCFDLKNKLINSTNNCIWWFKQAWFVFNDVNGVYWQSVIDVHLEDTLLALHSGWIYSSLLLFFSTE